MLGPKQHRVWKPVITAVHGMAAGGAMYFINESDIVICSDDATFFDPHANGDGGLAGRGDRLPAAGDEVGYRQRA